MRRISAPSCLVVARLTVFQVEISGLSNNPQDDEKNGNGDGNQRDETREPYDVTEIEESISPTILPTTAPAGSSRYILYKEELSWVLANSRCNGQLATIANDEEASELLSIVGESGESAWIGLHEHLSTGEWIWASGRSWSVMQITF